MKCTNCGFELQDDSLFCANCGVQLAPTATPPFAPENNRVLAMLKDNLFLVSCILITVATALSIIGGGLPVIEILLTVFMWLAYSQAAKGIADERHLRCISGTVYANYVATNVAAIILIVCGVIISALMGVLTNNLEFMNDFVFEFGQEFPGYESFAQTILGTLGWLIGLIIVVVAVSVLVINILGMKKIHSFVKSVYQSISNPYAQIADPRAVKNWLIFFGVCSGLSALSTVSENLLSAISAGCMAAVTIIAVIFVNKYFLSDIEK